MLLDLKPGLTDQPVLHIKLPVCVSENDPKPENETTDKLRAGLGCAMP